MRCDCARRENFLIAKIRDSESARRAFGCAGQVARGFAQRRSSSAMIMKQSAAQAFPATLTIGDVEFSGAFAVAPTMHRGADDERAARALTLSRQHFLKRDAVFFDVLVYSGCSAFRFPNARSELKPSHYIGGQHGQES